MLRNRVRMIMLLLLRVARRGDHELLLLLRRLVVDHRVTCVDRCRHQVLLVLRWRRGCVLVLVAECRLVRGRDGGCRRRGRQMMMMNWNRCLVRSGQVMLLLAVWLMLVVVLVVALLVRIRVVRMRMRMRLLMRVRVDMRMVGMMLVMICVGCRLGVVVRHRLVHGARVLLLLLL